VLKIVGASALTSGDSFGARRATYSARKSYQRVKVAGPSESMCVPFVNPGFRSWWAFER
jgi:hypothetical protein